jgi:hypothetical protein
VLRQSLRDLDEPRELRELGTALFLDRPLGAGKGPVEPDRTLLFSCTAFSRSIAERRLQELTAELGLLAPAACDRLRRSLEAEEVVGIPAADLRTATRPGTVSLADVRRAAEDFILLQSTRRSVEDFLSWYEFKPLASHFRIGWLTPPNRVLIVGETVSGRETVLTLFDASARRRMELSVEAADGYISRAGVEHPVGGLRVRRVWEPGAQPEEWREHDLDEETLVLRPVLR